MIREVRISIEGGVITDVVVPAGVRVVINDYDVDAGDAGDFCKNFFGDLYTEVVYEGPCS